MEIEEDDVGMVVDLPAKPEVGASCSVRFFIPVSISLTDGVLEHF
jgi:hypothetical protein